MNASDEMKKVFLAGIGAIATTAEKAKEVIDSFIEKGELTVEQGKVINEELKRNLSENLHHHSSARHMEDLLQKVNTLNEEELSVLKQKLAEMEKKNDPN
ncbi:MULTISPECIES: aspartyl beta-hydroxylase [Dehalobacter]|uniref:Aspartyl beta-hydroxylase n=1 Tax=Dehalobacter restrictus (strain DSM 9455 / PER-K23) TaxID=871738 RepID=A0ABM5P6U6_DEHRP|nr:MULTISPECIES: aspartyl beta-hydroxylase [Dehalobacter]AHF10371.1 aspartyl beta-hydroxylase [Dehalobacter restrictus DSM 9455]MDJ0304919.1 aspartyl beta-hydroxylase [Dehalobacter sp.]